MPPSQAMLTQPVYVHTAISATPDIGLPASASPICQSSAISTSTRSTLVTSLTISGDSPRDKQKQKKAPPAATRADIPSPVWVRVVTRSCVQRSTMFRKLPYGPSVVFM
mmetsp:Transcript_106935/g.184476  ORF Transcript_106935/g.184476 Transcript_106935/m.184476 type:complete len:109 (-) Transcript_106935:951-1277(-)